MFTVTAITQLGHYRTITIMSSKDKERIIEEVWQKEKMFDELLALILQGRCDIVLLVFSIIWLVLFLLKLHIYYEILVCMCNMYRIMLADLNIWFDHV